MKLPRHFRLIRLELAREPGHPEGSRLFGYRLVAPLDAEGRIDAELWRQHREACRVAHFRPDDDEEAGHLIRKDDGSWAFIYDVFGDEEEEIGCRFADERFIIGEYVSINEEGALHTFQVTSVEHV